MSQPNTQIITTIKQATKHHAPPSIMNILEQVAQKKI